jgi:hypothetical protein
MAISIVVSPAGDTPTEIQSTTRSVREVNATITASGDEMESNIIVIASSTGVSEPGITITSGPILATIVGKYADPFLDTFKYVNKGSSNKIETPTTVVGVQNMPPKKELFDLNQDTRLSELKTYQITVNYDDEFLVPGTETFTVTQKILNDLESIRSFIDTYYN